MQWVAEITDVRRQWEAQVPDQKVTWAATDEATNLAAETFTDLAGGQTSVHLSLEYPPECLVEEVGDKLNLVASQAPLARASASDRKPGPYQLLAEIAACHVTGGDAAATDWASVVALYARLHARPPTGRSP